MEVELNNFRHDNIDRENPIVRLNAEKRDQLGARLGDTVLIKRTKTVVETIEAVVHQARNADLEQVVLEGGEEVEGELTGVEVVTNDEDPVEEPEEPEEPEEGDENYEDM